MSELRAAIIEHIRRQVADEGSPFHRPPLVGFASADDPCFRKIPEVVGPHHLLPRDILPEAKTVVSFFLPFTKKVVKENQGSGPVARSWAETYLATNDLINRISRSLAEQRQAAGHPAAVVPATYGFDAQTFHTAWSHRSAAWVAGLGRFGLNRMLIGPAGGAGRYGTVFLSETVPPDPRPEEEFCRYFRDGRCRACLDACPVQALSPDGFQASRCYTRLLENDKILGLGHLADVCGKCVVNGPCAYHET